jgi:hypothetical protein
MARPPCKAPSTHAAPPASEQRSSAAAGRPAGRRPGPAPHGRCPPSWPAAAPCPPTILPALPAGRPARTQAGTHWSRGVNICTRPSTRAGAPGAPPRPHTLPRRCPGGRACISVLCCQRAAEAGAGPRLAVLGLCLVCPAARLEARAPPDANFKGGAVLPPIAPATLHQLRPLLGAAGQGHSGPPLSPRATNEGRSPILPPPP